MSKKRSKDPTFIFSKEMRERMSVFKDMDVSDALCDSRFWRGLCEHAGLDFDEISKQCNEENGHESKPLTPDDFGALLKTLEDGLGDNET